MKAGLKVAVVIPYFQRTPGLIDACVRSVLEQRDASVAQIIVVDDGSPLAAAQQLASLLRESDRVQLILQDNAGPGAARNRGIQAVDPDTDVVAFLDSDDQWQPWYLSDALIGFEAGCDVYFANSQRYGTDDTRFEWTNPSGVRLDLAEHHQVDRERGVYLYRGDFFDFAVFRSGIISTSTLAYRYSRFPVLRFNTTLFNGQDRLFKLQLSKLAGGIAFGTIVGAREGRGVNIFDASQWGSDRSLNLLLNYIRLAKLVLGAFDLSAKQRAFVRTQLYTTRYDLAGTVLHLLRNRKRIESKMLRSILLEDPLSALLFAPNALRAGVKMFAKRT